MYVVIFTARVAALDEQYGQTAQRMRQLALTEYGCLGFESVSENGTEISLSYWPSEAHIERWRTDAEHLAAQALGKSRWYEHYSVKVAQVTREYTHEGSPT